MSEEAKWTTSIPCRKRLCLLHGGGRSDRGRPQRRSWWGQSNNYPLVSGTGGDGKRRRELLANKYKRDQIHSDSPLAPAHIQGCRRPLPSAAGPMLPGRCLGLSPFGNIHRRPTSIFPSLSLGPLRRLPTCNAPQRQHCIASTPPHACCPLHDSDPPGAVQVWYAQGRR